MAGHKARTRLWIAQLSFALGGGIIWLFFPELSLHLVQASGLEDPVQRYAALIGQHYLGVWASAIGLLTILAISIKSEADHRWLAKGFGVYFPIWSFWVGFNYLEEPGVTGAWITIAMVTFTAGLGVANLMVAASIPPDAGPPPSEPWRVWRAQGAFFVVAGLILFVFGEGLIAPGVLHETALSPMAGGQFQIASSYHLSLGAMSLYGAFHTHKSLFPYLALIFSFVGAAFVGVTAHGFATSTFMSPWLLAPYLLMSIFFVISNLEALLRLPRV